MGIAQGMSITIAKIGAVGIVHQDTLIFRQAALGLMRFLTSMLAPVIVGVDRVTENMQPIGLSIHPNTGFIAMTDRRGPHGCFNRLFYWLKRGISLLQDALQRPATRLITQQRVQKLPGAFIGQQLVVQQIGTKSFEPPPILKMPTQVLWPLASVATAAAWALFFQALMFNNLHRFLREFDLLTTRHHRSFNLVQ